MAKKHKNLENIKIQWDGDLTDPPYGTGDKNQSIPTNVDLGKWGGNTGHGQDPCGWSWCFDEAYGWVDSANNECYYEDWDVNNDGVFDVVDVVDFVARSTGVLSCEGGVSIDVSHVLAAVNLQVNTPELIPPPRPKPISWIWGDVSFVIEIADGIGTGSRRAREARLNKFEQEKKKRLIRLICRVKGEKVYDEEKVMGDTYIKLEDAELVINEVLGKMRVENANVL